MDDVTFELDTRGAARMFAQLDASQPNRAARAVNRAGMSARTVIVRAMAKDTGLKQKDIRPKIHVTKARPGRDPSFRIRASRKRLPLIKFGAKQFSFGVRARLGSGLKRYTGAFITTVGAGHTGVFRRAKSGGNRVARLPIQELHGPSLGQVLRKVFRSAEDRFREQVAKNLARELRFASRGR